ncbi:ammonium transporter [Bombiscardovia nodaiensis]|uniref:Ammonium transporter n=1 Tax=Bombiscardovia nodaiensis TaxID=2932181 RepID=A0ABN6SEW5_9BIFI|nr:ammonium transporter [Bombiscardovia nodaiensis]
MDSGSTAWMLMAAGLVFLMTPALALFYGGMVRAKSVLNMLMLSLGAGIVTTLVWGVWGWSLAFAGKDIGGIFGDPGTGFLLRDTVVAKNGMFTSVDPKDALYPHIIDVGFQGALAMFAVALISGALAERVKFSTWIVFVALWVSFDYAPLAHMVWNHGLLAADGPISNALGAPLRDFAGGSVVQLNAAIAALVIVIIIGGRKGFGERLVGPHNLPMTLSGVGLLCFGWLGLNAGSAFSATGTAGYAWVSTALAVCSSALGWMVTQKIRSGHYTARGAAYGIMAGLAVISPAAASVAPLWAIVMGLAAGVACCFTVSLKYSLKYDDSLNVVGINGVAGLLGMLLLGLFAAGTGLFSGGGFRQLLVQFVVCLIVIVYSAVVTGVIAFALEKTLGWRLSEAQEEAGADIASQGERAYQLTNKFE